jgi:hypothetical protein
MRPFCTLFDGPARELDLDMSPRYLERVLRKYF